MKQKREKNICFIHHLFQKLFIQPLKQSSLQEKEEERLVTPQEFEEIFGIIEVIIKISGDHLEDMKNAAAERTQRIGSVFLRLCPWLKHYAVYVNSFDDSVKSIQAAKKRNPKLATFLRNGEKKSTCNYDFSSYRILPVQRLGRYEMLLKRLFECSPKWFLSLSLFVTLSLTKPDIPHSFILILHSLPADPLPHTH